MSHPDVIVVGAGALGWACAEALARRGAAVDLIDSGDPSASAVAAGMLAPALESVLERGTADRAEVYRSARDLWPEVAARTGLNLSRAGALWAGDDAELVRRRLLALGFAAERRPAGVFTPDDWTIDATAALRFTPAGVRRRKARAGGVAPGRVTLEGGTVAATLVVLCIGAASVDAPEADPALAAVAPIRGQILHLPGAAPPPTVLRAEGVYVVPRGDGTVVGATMDAGRTDLQPDPAATADLLAQSAKLWPGVVEAGAVQVRVGIRGATPDGLPLVGPVAPGLAVALAPRRNGWLLAPLVGAMVAAYAAGDDPGPYAKALDPLRFKRS